MEDSQLSFDAMTRETMEMSQSFGDTEFSFNENSSETELKIENTTTELAPHSSGVIFRLEKGINTFCIRGVPSENLAEDLEDLKESDHIFFKALKINSVEDKQDIQFFCTESIELAEIICDELINRRFPIKEDILCNLSDPGFSWWLDEADNYFQVFFKSHGIHRAENYNRLGPMGDPSIAGARLLKAESIFRSAFPVADFASTDKSFAISTTDPENPNFIILKNIFVLGQNTTTRENFPATSDGKTLYYYFKELAALRSFWMKLEDQIAE